MAQNNSILDVVFHQNIKLFYSIIYKYTNNKWDTEDVLQEVYYRALKADRTKIRPEDYKKWLAKICVNTSITYINKALHEVATEDGMLDTTTASNIDEFIEINQDEYILTVIDAVLLSVPVELREILKINILEGAPLDRICRERSVTRATARHWKNKFLKNIEKYL